MIKTRKLNSITQVIIVLSSVLPHISLSFNIGDIINIHHNYITIRIQNVLRNLRTWWWGTTRTCTCWRRFIRLGSNALPNPSNATSIHGWFCNSSWDDKKLGGTRRHRRYPYQRLRLHRRRRRSNNYNTCSTTATATVTPNTPSTTTSTTRRDPLFYANTLFAIDSFHLKFFSISATHKGQLWLKQMIFNRQNSFAALTLNG